MLASILRAGGRRTALMTSPHLVSYTERIQLDGAAIGEADFAAAVEDLRPRLEGITEELGAPTEFEILTTLAVGYLAPRSDRFVCEVGMGGRLDSTNVLDLGVAVITNVDLDHQQYLGDTLEEIAGEKAGIIKADAIAVLAHQEPGALDTLVRRAVEVEAVVAREGTEFGVLERRVAVGGQQVRLQGLGGEYEEIFLPLFGAHQAQNAVTALAAVEAFLGAGAATGPIEQETVRAAFVAVSSPGRLERVRTSPSVLLDAAHNPAGMAATVDALRESFDFTRLIGVVGCVVGKDVHGMLAALEDVCAELVVTQNSSARAIPADELGALAVDVFGADRVSVHPVLADALESAMELAEAGPDDALGGSGVLVTGSVITVGEARTLLTGRRS